MSFQYFVMKSLSFSWNNEKNAIKSMPFGFASYKSMETFKRNANSNPNSADDYSRNYVHFEILRLEQFSCQCE